MEDRYCRLQSSRLKSADGEISRMAHVCYESGERDTARAFLSSWLASYPRDGFFHGHLSWHLSLCELEAGNSRRL
jgi:hypothetical protein